MNRRKALIIIASTISIVAILVLIYLYLNHAHLIGTQPSQQPTITNDPTSGESFYNRPGLLPEPSALAPNTPTYAGFSALVNDGVTSDQVIGIEQALQQYGPFASNKIEISLATNDLRPGSPSPSDPLYRWSISSHIVVNQSKTYQIRFYYWGTGNIELFIYDATGSTQLFDSGTITANN